MTVYLDTNACLILLRGDLNALSKLAVAALESNALLISPVVLLELEYLYEVGRLSITSQDAFTKLNMEVGIELCSLPFPQVAAAAVRESWTRDPFDRLIVAQAKANGLATLITRDRKIRRHYPRAIW